MTTKYDGENDRRENRPETDRYAAFTDGEGRVVVYDTRNHAAWLESDAGVEIAEMA
ncbi:DUF7331 family protein [Halorussus marinus]|uniref:DUF7331 family protein n=1 Tax=Halorussus marinus TaxID=2505976 RepID=UPI0014319390|nr:hypothetical protein [Halorussus marinus]